MRIANASLWQMDLIGRSLLEFLHPCDQMEVKDILTRLIGEHSLFCIHLSFSFLYGNDCSIFRIRLYLISLWYFRKPRTAGMWNFPKNKKCIEPETVSLESESSFFIFAKAKDHAPHWYFLSLCCEQIIQCMGKKKSSATPGSSCLVLQCRLLPMHQFIETDAAMNTNTFMSIHSPDMKFTYCHTRYNLMTVQR